MEDRIEKIEAKVYSPAVVVAFFGLLGTIASAGGGVIAAVIMAWWGGK